MSEYRNSPHTYTIVLVCTICNMTKYPSVDRDGEVRARAVWHEMHQHDEVISHPFIDHLAAWMDARGLK